MARFARSLTTTWSLCASTSATRTSPESIRSTAAVITLAASVSPGFSSARCSQNSSISAGRAELWSMRSEPSGASSHRRCSGYLLMVAKARSGRVGAGAVLVVVLVIVALALAKANHVPLVPSIGDGCLVHSDEFDVPLSTGQAGLAATIAGVANHRALPDRAVAIAYATALQESDLENLPYGDRDSVGVFQQRPSQGWGTRQQLLNPIYATTRFFTALAAIPGYRKLPVYQAAQDVQRSADGSAYIQYVPQGAVMASGFTGTAPRSVWCWYTSGISGRGRLAAAGKDLAEAFGRLGVRHSGDPTMAIKV